MREHPGADERLEPFPDFAGADSFVVRVDDGAVSATALISVFVERVDDLPLLRDDFTGAPFGTAVHIDVPANDLHPEENQSVIGVLGSPAGGTALVNTSGTVTYRPTAGFRGVDVFIYDACDPAGRCATVAVTVSVG